MALLVGAILAIAVAILATSVGLDRDRAFYPVVTIVVASYYALFAAMGASTDTIVLESLVGVAFLALAVVGFRSSLWIVMVALGGARHFRPQPWAYHIKSGHAELVAKILFHIRCFVGGVPGLAAQNGAHPRVMGFTIVWAACANPSRRTCVPRG